MKVFSIMKRNECFDKSKGIETAIENIAAASAVQSVSYAIGTYADTKYERSEKRPKIISTMP